jgi:hypothetical protein
VDANAKATNANAVPTANVSQGATAVVRNKIIKNRRNGWFFMILFDKL